MSITREVPILKSLIFSLLLLSPAFAANEPKVGELGVRGGRLSVLHEDLIKMAFGRGANWVADL